VTETKSRRRGAELERAILDAAWAELNDVGYAALTMEAVAARAGTSKPVIYRRWSSRAELVLAAWRRKEPAQIRTTNSGSLRSDLIFLFVRIAQRAGGIMSEAMAGVMGEAFRHPEVAALLRERLKSAPQKWIDEIVGRAVERGELGPVTVPPRAARLPLELIRGQTLTGEGPVSRKEIEEIVDDVYIPLLRGLAARHASSPRSARLELGDRAGQ
jgi:AcrR family transcriptional regulator